MDKKYLEETTEFKLQLLGRMQEDCKYYLGAGNKQVKNLWSGNVDDQIADMKELYLSIPKDERPDWISVSEINGYSEKMDHRPVITHSDLGKARYTEYFHNGKRVDDKKGANECFFHTEKRNGERKHGYIEITPAMQHIFNTLIQERKNSMCISFIEWDDSYNAVFNDGLFISSKMCRIEKADFAEWERKIEAAVIR